MPLPAPLRPLLRTTPTTAPVLNRALLAVSGSDATSFLNGLLAVTVKANPSYGALLHAQGRVLHDIFLYTAPASSYLIEYDPAPSDAHPLLSILRRFVLRSKVRIHDVTHEWDVWAAWGDEHAPERREWDWATSGAVEPVWKNATHWPWGTQHRVILDRRAPRMGRRFIVPKGERPPETSTHDVLDSNAYLLHRILHGVPEGTTDIPPLHALPIESNLDVMGGVDFRKGCYVGQELTVRTYHTGAIRKRILPVTLSSSTQHAAHPLPNLSIKPSVLSPSSDSDAPSTRTPRLRGTSTLFSSIPTPSITPGTAVGLALLRLDHLRPSIELLAEDAGSAGNKWKVEHWLPDWWPNQPAETNNMDA